MRGGWSHALQYRHINPSDILELAWPHELFYTFSPLTLIPSHQSEGTQPQTDSDSSTVASVYTPLATALPTPLEQLQLWAWPESGFIWPLPCSLNVDKPKQPALLPLGLCLTLSGKYCVLNILVHILKSHIVNFAWHQLPLPLHAHVTLLASENHSVRLMQPPHIQHQNAALRTVDEMLYPPLLEESALWLCAHASSCSVFA